MSRNHVHLSKDWQTALGVGKRHGKPVVLTIDCKEMAQNGYKFFLSANGVWFTDSVPAKYIAERHMDYP
ncbi:MAG: RNA 2'-phosphotransferase [Paludibacteraceae bacterium]|nr:RNA 2'-phosphotransferase [Paludibacteraceae bacterium]